VPGTEYDGIQHQDIQHFSFEDGTFDVVMSLDVLEHVDDPVTAACELFRILKPGGFGILTFPFYPNQTSTIIRSRMRKDGAIENVRRAQFHGNPLGGGSLVFRELSWDYISTLQEQLGDAVTFLNYWSLYRAHFGAERFALLLNKKVAL
jgi:SAM-dependent methyltransferase